MKTLHAVLTMLVGPVVVVLAVLLMTIEPSAQTSQPKPKTRRPPAAKKVDEAKPAEAPAKSAAPPHVTIAASYASGAEPAENTVYSNGVRQRFEFGGGTTLIAQCDLERTIQINDKARTFLITPADVGAKGAPPAPSGQPSPNAGGVVRIKTTITDTGERKELFGFPARRFRTVVVKEPAPGACDKKKERVETDGWYAEVPFVLQCAYAASSSAPAPATECKDELQVVSEGPARAGHPFAYTMTTYGEDNKAASTLTMEVKEVSTTPLDGARFDPPAGYREVKTIDELNTIAADAASAEPASDASRKKPATTRIGVVRPVNKTDEPVSIGALHGDLVAELSEAPFDAWPIRGDSPEAIQAEAKKRDCDYILYTDIALLKTTTSGRVGGLLRRASGGGSSKENHEVRFDFRLLDASASTPRLASSASAKTGGFTWKRALRLARFAGAMYLMMGPRMLSTLQSTQAGDGGGSGAAPGGDPTMGAAMFLLDRLGGSGQEEETSLEATIGAAIEREAQAIVKAIRPAAAPK